MKKLSLSKRVHGYLGTILLILTLALAAFLRLYRLGTLPPGLHPSEAHWLRLGIDISQNHTYGVLLKPANIPFDLFIILQGLLTSLTRSVHLLRVESAVFGLLVVGGIYVWSKQWFGRRTALIAAFFAAISPWLVIMSRNIWPVNLSLVFFVWLMVLLTKAYRTKSLGYSVASALVLIFGCTTSRLFLIVPALLLVCLCIAILRKGIKDVVGREILVGIIVSALLILPLVFVTVVSQKNSAVGIRAKVVGASKQTSIAVTSKTIVDNTGRTALMFFVSGDEDYTRNLAGLPMLDSFVGLMLVLGLLVSVSRLKQARYDFLVIGLVIMLLPAILLTSTSIPDAYHAALSVPIVLILAGVGTNYLLARWYSMFPINTTARSLGLAFIVFLLSLSAYIGYRQYFVAWAQDPKTYTTYREDLKGIAAFMKANGVERKAFVVADEGAVTAVAVQLHRSDIRIVGGDIVAAEALPLSNKPTFVIIPQQSMTSEQNARLQAKFPGAVLGSEKSPFDDRVLFSWYRIQ